MPSTGWAVDYYVAIQGKDTNGGSSAALFRTIQRAVSEVGAGGSGHCA
ncbi:MAG: hypothetical protein R3C68_01000 [Myxococcota bacterium]